MSNPGINRWGINLFWYNFWFKDKTRQINIHLDDLINELIYVYIKYGLYSDKSIFLSNYRFLDQKEVMDSYKEEHTLNYFRFGEFKDRVLEETILLKIRIGAKNIYHSKLWIMRYQKWLIINFYCFQPLKKKKIKKKKDNNSKKSLNFLMEKNNISQKLFIKYRILFSLTLNSILIKKNYFSF